MNQQLFLACLGVVLISGVAQAGVGEASLVADQAAGASPTNEMKAYWKDGFRLETADKSFTLRIGGRAQYDMAWFDADDANFPGLEFNDGVELRRFYMSFSGTIYGNIDYQLETNLSKTGTDLQDTFLATKTSMGRVKVGHFKQPIGMEENGSDLHLAFMERSLSGAMKTGRDTGVMLSDTCMEERATWAVGIFKDTDDQGKNSSATSDDEYAFTARTTYMPWLAEDGKCLANVGLAYSVRNMSGDGTTFEARPEADLAPKLLTAAIADADSYDLVGFEAAAIVDSFSFAAEYMQAMVDSDAESDPDLTGWYAYVTYLLSGESRSFNKTNATFGRVKPASNYSAEGGWGAFEVGLRLSSIDYGDVGSGDATLDDVTLGLTWFLNPNAKVMANIVQASLNDDDLGIDEDATAYMLRFQFDI